MEQEIIKMRELASRLAAADVAYYKHDDPIMTDFEYDYLYSELIELEKLTGIVLSGSPTQKTSGEVLDSLPQIRHTRPMLSAKKTKSVDEVIEFISGREAVVSWKLDGLTLVLRYDGGKLIQALTRGGGSGTVGEDVTHCVRVMMNVPLAIPYTGYLEARGEGIVSWDNFAIANQNPEESYSLPRSLTAGAIRRLDSRKTKSQNLEFFAFDLITEGIAGSRKSDQLAFLARCGFTVVDHVVVNEQSGEQSDEQNDTHSGEQSGEQNDAHSGEQSGEQYHTQSGEQFGEQYIRSVLSNFDPKSFGYPVDGLVIEYNDLLFAQTLGATGHHENRLIALKWEDELYETTFLGLELATTRTGMVSLTGVFEDTIIDGTKVNRAYLHNLDIFDGLRLGKGDRVKIYKANQIIPQVAENMTQSGTLAYPAQCPCCGESLTIRASDSGTRLLYCVNATCPAKLVQKFVHFCGKSAMDIPDLSGKRLELFIGNGWVKNFGDLYELERHREAFINTPGFGEKLFDKITASIDSRRRCTLSQFISGLGIPMVGRSTSRVLDSHFNGDWEAFEQAIKSGYDFTQLQDFGQTMRDNICKWYADAEEETLWRPLLKHITFIKNENGSGSGSETPGADNPFSGKVVVATGKLINYSRDGIQAKLLSLGAKPTGSISKSTDYLIVGENAGGKLEKARQLGVRTLSEEEFEAMIE